MAYPGQCIEDGATNNCPRPGFFSTPDYSYLGIPMGEENRDNRNQLISAASEIACYRNAPSSVATVYFEGTVQSLDKFGVNEFPEISVGDKMWGSYQLLTDTPESDQTSNDPTFGLYLESIPLFELNVGPYTFSNIEADELSVRDNNDYSDLGVVDLFGIYMYANIVGNIDGWTAPTFVLQMVDPSATVFSSDEIPIRIPSPNDFGSEETKMVLPLEFNDGNNFASLTVTANIERHFEGND
jgi:hypothetical protein